MLFATQGAGNAKGDLIDVQKKVAASSSNPSANRYRFVYFVRAMQDLSRRGMTAEQSKWISTSSPNVFVYTGDPQGSQFTGTHVRIWAAVEVSGTGQLVALLRVADGYQGNQNDYANYEIEAFQRLKGGRIP
jgi:hypothetical protein